MSINCVCISGNLVKDCEKKQAGDSPLVIFIVAVNARKRNSDGEWEDYPNFIECTLYGNRAKGLAQWLTKGAKVTVLGKLHQQRWEKDGQNMSKISVRVDEIEFYLPPKNKSEQDEIPW